MANTSYGTITITDTTDLEWFYGIILDGTGDATNHQIILTTNLITGAAVGSMYLNTQTSLVYKCVAASDTSQTWQYVGNMTAGVQDEIEDASKVATNYLAVDETGIMVAELSDSEETPSTATTKNVFIDSNSVDVRDGQNVLASFGENTIIGDSTKSKLELSANEVVGYGDHGQELFKLSGNGGVGQDSVVREQIIYYGPAQIFPTSQNVPISKTLTFLPAAFKSMRIYFIPENVDDESEYYTSQYFEQVDSQGNQIAGTQSGGFRRLLQSGMTGNFEYTFYAKFHPDGYSQGGGITSYTISFNYDKNTGTFSNMKANSQIFFNRYDENTTGPYSSTVQTVLNVKVQYFTEEPTPAFSFGSFNDTTLAGSYSTMIGTGLQAWGNHQVVIGKYNIPLAASGALFIIGNGTGNDERNNLLTIEGEDSTSLCTLSFDGQIIANVDMVANGNMFANNISVDNNITVGSSEVSTPKIDLLSNKGRMSFQTSANNTGIWDTTNGQNGYWLIAHRFDNDHAYIGKYLEVPNNAIIKEQKMVYEAGDIINCFGLRCAGLLTNSGKNIEFFIPLPKPVTSNLKASISGNWAIRQVGGGYLLNSATLASIGTVTITIVDLGIYVTVVASTAFSATNNTPVVVSATGNAAGTATGNSKITFSTQ